MKKIILALPVAMLLLSGCDTKTSTNTGPKPTAPAPSPTSVLPPPSMDTSATPVPQGPDSIPGYHKVIEAPKDDATYLYGNYQPNIEDGTMIFMDGGIHKDANGTYPWYATSTTDPSKAALIKVHYVSETKFTLQFISGGDSVDTDSRVHVDPPKYLSIGETLNSRTQKWDISFSFVDENPSQFVWAENLKAPQVLFDSSCKVEGAESAVLGTYESYTSFSAVREFRYETNFLAHLWEADEVSV